MQTLRQRARKKVLNLANGTEHLLTQKGVSILMKMPNFSARYQIFEGDYIYNNYGEIVELQLDAPPLRAQEDPRPKPSKPSKNSEILINLTQDEK